MTPDKIHEIAETYIYGNIVDVRMDIAEMSKADFVKLLDEISDVGGCLTSHDKMWFVKSLIV